VGLWGCGVELWSCVDVGVPLATDQHWRRRPMRPCVCVREERRGEEKRRKPPGQKIECNAAGSGIWEREEKTGRDMAAGGCVWLWCLFALFPGCVGGFVFPFYLPILIPEIWNWWIASAIFVSSFSW